MKFLELKDKINKNLGMGMIENLNSFTFMLVASTDVKVYGKNLIDPSSWDEIIEGVEPRFGHKFFNEFEYTIDEDGDLYGRRYFNAVTEEGENLHFREIIYMTPPYNDSDELSKPTKLWYIEIPNEWTK